MLNRLIIAVFGIVLVMAFCGTAIAGPVLTEDGQLGVAQFYPNAPRAADLASHDVRPVQPNQKKPVSALRALPPGSVSGLSPSLVYFCDIQGYTGTLTYILTIPDIYGDDFYNTRFTVEDNFDCTLKVAHLLLYGDPTWGTPDVRVYLWADDGFGFPGAVLDSVDIPNASLPGAGAAYVSADFSASGWVFSDGAEYHYGYTVIGGAGDTVGIVLDAADGPSVGEGRSSEFYLGAWGSLLVDYGADYCFEILSERCCSEIPFSDCYSQAYGGGPAFVWFAPDPTFGDSAYAMRFDVGGPETLQSVDVLLYAGLGALGDEDVYVTIYDDAAGFPGSPIAGPVTLTGGTYPVFPSYANASFSPLVLEETFHVVVTSAGVPGASYEAIISDNGTFGTGRASASGDPGGGPGWYPSAFYGADLNWKFIANLCRDEFSDCVTKNYGLNSGFVYPIPDNNPIIGWAQKFQFGHGSECELRETFIVMYRHPADSIRPNMYTFDTEINVYDDAGGIPGALIDQQILTPADYAAAGYTGSNYFGFLLFSLTWATPVPSSFFIELQSLAPTRDEGIRMFYDPNGLGGGPADGLVAFAPAFGGYIPNPFWASQAAMYMDAKVCCVPFTGRPCTPPDEWAAGSHDLGRTGLSQLAIEDAWCDLTVDWYFETPANTIQFNSAIVYDGRVFVATSSGTGSGSNIEVFDLYDGTHLETISGAAFGNFVLNDPVIANDVLYIAGGDNRTISAWDVSVWGASANLWSRVLGGAVGQTRFTELLLVNVGGTDVLYGGSQTGRAFAINASDGLDYPGWASNPIVLDANLVVLGSATDGSQLFFGTYIAGLNGDVWAIDAATGSVNWQLSGTGGYQGGAVYPTATAEAFPSLSYEAGKIFAGSRVSGNYPADGVFYSINSADGSLNYFTGSPGYLYTSFITDVNLVYALTTGRWIGGTVYDYPIYAFAKLSGAVAWTQEHIHETNDQAIHFGNGALSCEPEPAVDILISNPAEGTFSFWHSLTGENLFRRRWDYGPGVSDGTAATIGLDSSGAVHVLGTSLFGGVVSMAKGADRPRLEIQDYDPQVAVEFSASTSVIYTVPDIIANTGCADLTFIAVNVDDASFGSTDPGIVSVRPGLLEVTNTLADQLAANSSFAKAVREKSFEADVKENTVKSMREFSYRNERGNRAAMAFPVYLNGVNQPFAGQVVAAGDSIDLVLDVNASLIERGPQVFYVELNTDDPDFFLNAGSAFLPNDYPELIVTLVGGCLIDTTTLEFGNSGANIQLVTNTVRLAEGDWSPHGFDVDGETDPIFQGTYVFGVSTERIAMSVSSWQSGETFASSWIGCQGDPNWCDNQCKPALTTGVSLGAIDDGTCSGTYVPITGNMICVSWIDSVQDFSLLDGPGVDLPNWDWRNFGAPFDDSLTMGLSANTRTIGALDTDGLTNLTVEIFEVTERNGDSVPGWKFACFYDYDLAPAFGGGPDTAILDQASSSAWTTSAANAASVDYAYGVVKLPFGCGYEPMKNTMGCDAGQAQFESTAGRGNPYWDSAYFYMNLPSGTERSHVMQGSPDQEWHATLVEHDFGPNETFTFASVNFMLNDGVSDPSAPGGGGEIADLAHLTNKWVGFGRGDVNDDNAINLGDIMTLAGIVNGSVPGACPFEHLADVDADTDVDAADLQYLIDYYFGCGPCPLGDWQF